MGSRTLVYVLLMVAIATVDCNSEGDVLNTWKNNLADPNNVLQSWDPTLVNPCTWFHVTCNSQDSVTRLDLGDAGLSGSLIPGLANLTNLQYLEAFSNNITGSIPSEFGKLSALVSLDLYHNRLSGPIPSSLGNLTALRFLRLNSNLLSGTLPMEVIQLVQWGNLSIMNVSDNKLAGRVPPTNSKGFAITEIIQDPKA